jgi:hypothetical protein
MEARNYSIHDLFVNARQYKVPYYQRAYVWSKADQWERLWSDIEEKAEGRVSGSNATPHFMGALVLEPTARQNLMGTDTVNIVDGQQRLTTLQFLIAGLSLAAVELTLFDQVPIVNAYRFNGINAAMINKDLEIYKVWPTTSDRAAYREVMKSKSFDDLRSGFKVHVTQVGWLKKVGIKHPAALEASWFFADKAIEWVGRESPDKAERLIALTTAAMYDLMVVGILLGPDDDAQVIFETLNGHGEPLTATDLIRNYIFLKAEGGDADAEALHAKYWAKFDLGEWTALETRARSTRSRLEWFILALLQAELREEIDQGRIYAEFKKVTGKLSAEKVLELLNRYAELYTALIKADYNTPIGIFGREYNKWDVSTTHPMALTIGTRAAPEHQVQMFQMLGSYIARRAICDLTNKGYNKNFLAMLRALGSGPVTPEALRAAMLGMRGDSSRWPDDDELHAAFISKPIYHGALDVVKTRSVLSALENALRTEKSEEPYWAPADVLDVDHMLPQAWHEYWPLLVDGQVVVVTEASRAEAGLAVALGTATDVQKAIVARDALVPTIGNLTLLHYGVNRSLKHHGLAIKQANYLEHTNLSLNNDIRIAKEWGSENIRGRSERLYKAALKSWPR